jgi:RHS repeat-associated protein
VVRKNPAGHARNVGIWRWNQTNDPFGESTPNQNPDGDTTSFTFNLRFAGQYRDSESGWYYNVHRYYDPSIGRYLESDPIGLNGGISTYSYVGAAPLTANDPLGLFGQSASQAFAGAYSGGRMNQIQGQGRFQQAMSREYSVGLGGTAFGSIKGGSLGVSVAVSGWALSIVGQSCFGLGGGAFIGGGLQFGAQNVTSCDLEKDSWISHQLQFEGGKGVVGGAAIDLSGSGISVNPSDKLKLGVGAGGYAAGMMCINGRWIIVDWR